MRGYTHSTNSSVAEDGSNLSSLLYNLCEKQGRTLEVLAFVKSLPEQDIEGIDFIETERREVMVKLEESFGGRRNFRAAPNLSDGTLRVLAIAATLLSAAEESIVVIEEIDNGIHPNRAKMLIRHILEVAKSRKLSVVLSSHNPALLDALPPSTLGDVVCCYRDPDSGDSCLVRLQDLPRFPSLTAQGPLGYLSTAGILDRFLKDTTSAEERKEKNLAWVEELNASLSR